MTFSTTPSKPPSHSSRNPIRTDVATMLVENRKAFLRFLTRHVGSKDTAEEILQRFYLRAISKASAIRKQESILRWLFRVLNSTLADFYRAETARLRGEGEYGRLQSKLLNEFDTDSNSLCMCFYQLLPTLKPTYAEVLQRVDLCGDSRPKVAKDLGMTLNSLRVRLHRARQALRSALLASCKGCEHGFMKCECAHKVKERI